MDTPLYVLTALLINLPIGLYSYKKKALSMPGGIIAAAVTGAMIFLAHWVLWVLMMAFFVSSTLLTKFREESKEKVEAMDYAEKGGQRDMWQVLANGGIPLALSAGMVWFNGVAGTAVDNVLFLFAAASLSTSTADTWATEVGTTSKDDPVWVLDINRRVPRGTSGGVSWRGLVGTALGALLIATSYLLLSLPEGFFITEMILIVIAGVIGSLVDTILGATIQAVNYCEECGKSTEQRVHVRCGSETRYQKGLKWFSNDLVNFLSGLIAALVVTPGFLFLS